MQKGCMAALFEDLPPSFMDQRSTTECEEGCPDPGPKGCLSMTSSVAHCRSSIQSLHYQLLPDRRLASLPQKVGYTEAASVYKSLKTWLAETRALLATRSWNVGTRTS